MNKDKDRYVFKYPCGYFYRGSRGLSGGYKVKNPMNATVYLAKNSTTQAGTWMTLYDAINEYSIPMEGTFSLDEIEQAKAMIEEIKHGKQS